MIYQINNQQPMPIERKDDGGVYVHSIFETIQGEGPFAGQAALFIRLTGCNLQCPGCDTEYTSESRYFLPRELRSHVAEIYPYRESDYKPLIVITGGEPFRQNINLLTSVLLAYGYRVQIESNGVLYPGDDFPWGQATVVISPKTGKIHPKTAVRATAYKYVLSWDGVMGDGLPERALGHPLGGAQHVARPPVGWEGPVYLQPMDVKDAIENQRNIQAVVESVMRNKRYIMGVQMHKLTGLP
jgi:7-carboxy-7-deazaguanine synthase